MVVRSSGTSSRSVAPSEAAVEKQAEAEFLGEARDVINNLNLTLQSARTGSTASPQALAEVLREAVNLKMRAKTVNMPTINIVAHRLEDYANALRDLDSQAVEDMQAFVDRIDAMLEGDSAEEAGEVADIVRELPAKRTFNVADVTYTPVEIVLVMNKRTQARVVERELAACGYTCTTSLDPFEAIELVTRTRPDMVLSAAVMEDLSGVDLASALAAMPATQSIPVALVTSLDPDQAELAKLPTSTGLIRRGQTFGEDLAQVLARFGII